MFVCVCARGVEAGLCVCVFFEPGLNGVCSCCQLLVVLAFSVKLISPFFSNSRTTRWGSQEVLQGLLRCLGGGISRGDAVGVPWWALVSWWCITQGDAVGYPGGLSCIGGDITRGGARGYPGGLSWDGGDITQGDAVIALTF